MDGEQDAHRCSSWTTGTASAADEVFLFLEAPGGLHVRTSLWSVGPRGGQKLSRDSLTQCCTICQFPSSLLSAWMCFCHSFVLPCRARARQTLVVLTVPSLHLAQETNSSIFIAFFFIKKNTFSPFSFFQKKKKQTCFSLFVLFPFC